MGGLLLNFSANLIQPTALSFPRTNVLNAEGLVESEGEPTGDGIVFKVVVPEGYFFNGLGKRGEEGAQVRQADGVGNQVVDFGGWVDGEARCKGGVSQQVVGHGSENAMRARRRETRDVQLLS